MSRASGVMTEERGIIDVDAIGGDLVAAHLKYIGERNTEHRAIVTRIDHLSLANGGPSLIPELKNPMLTGANRRKKSRRRCAYRVTTGDHGNVSELKLRIRSEQVNEGIRIADIDNRKYARPPSAIALYSCGGYNIDAHGISDAKGRALRGMAIIPHGVLEAVTTF
jgi:hypothetical protein